MEVRETRVQIIHGGEGDSKGEMQGELQIGRMGEDNGKEPEESEKVEGEGEGKEGKKGR